MKCLVKEIFFFLVNFIQLLPLIIQVTYILGFQKIIVLQNIAPVQIMWILDQQKDKKTLVIDSYRESEYEIHTVLENAPLLLQKSESKTLFHEN